MRDLPPDGLPASSEMRSQEAMPSKPASEREADLKRVRDVVLPGLALAFVVGVIAVGVRAEWSSDAWTAAATWITAAVAIVASIAAFRQLREARRMRLEQSQPYVAVFMEASEVDPGFVDLVIRNFGATAAMNIEIEIDPAPQQAAGGGPRDLWVPARLPALVPSQEWRTLWDYIRPRSEAGLPDKATASVEFCDPQGRPFSFTYALDWEPYAKRGNLIVYGPHHSAKALREIEKSIKKWSESIHGGLAVTVRDGDAKDQRRKGE